MSGFSILSLQHQQLEAIDFWYCW